MNKPEPVSADGNFEFISTSVIPGPAFGTLATIKSKTNTKLMLGLYRIGKDSVEYNFGLQQKINWFIFQKIGVSGYYANYKNSDKDYITGLAFNVAFKKASLMLFRGIDANSDITYSGFTAINLTESLVFFTDIVYQKKEWQDVEIGVFETLSEKIDAIEIGYNLGMGYNYSEVRPNYVKFYLQVWLDK
jgi:hypothetical protein